MEELLSVQKEPKVPIPKDISIATNVNFEIEKDLQVDLTSFFFKKDFEIRFFL